MKCIISKLNAEINRTNVPVLPSGEFYQGSVCVVYEGSGYPLIGEQKDTGANRVSRNMGTLPIGASYEISSKNIEFSLYDWDGVTQQNTPLTPVGNVYWIKTRTGNIRNGVLLIVCKNSSNIAITPTDVLNDITIEIKA